jgi:hypothetical protein
MSTATSPVAERVAEIEQEVETRMAAIDARITSAHNEDRDLTAYELHLSRRDKAAADKLEAEADQIRHQAVELRSRQIFGELDKMRRGQAETRGGHSPLLVSEAHLRSHAEAIAAGSTFGAEERLEVETRATVTVATDMGSPGDWGAPRIAEPTTLRAFAGIPASNLNGATAQMPSLTLPAGAAGVAETANHGEYDTVDVVNLTALRYGRWTSVTAAADAFDELQSINRAHSIGVARDLNLLDVTAIQTAAGTVVAFDAPNLDRNVRTAVLKVAAAALVDVEDVVLFGTSAALGVVTGYAPASGSDRGSVSLRVYGARVYVTESALAGNVYAFAPSAFTVFSTRLRSASTIDPKSGGNTFGQWLHSTGPGVGVVGGAAGVDVVTP